MEEWKSIEDYDNYEISNLGNVKNKKRNKLLTPSLSKNGYLYIDLYKNNKSKKYTIHKLLGLLFVSNPNNLSIIDHIDRNKLNNSIDNLRWVSPSQNLYNKTKKENTFSKYRGVYLFDIRNYKKFQVKLCVNGKSIHIGLFDTEEEGAFAYNEAIKKYNLEDFIEPNVL